MRKKQVGTLWIGWGVSSPGSSMRSSSGTMSFDSRPRSRLLIGCTDHEPFEILRASDLLLLPLASPKQKDAGERDRSLGNDDGNEDSGGTKPLVESEPPGQRNLQYPEAEEIHNCRRDGIAGAVERLQHDHSVCIGDVAITQDAQGRGGKGDDGWIVSEKADQRRGRKNEDDADDPEKEHVIQSRAPHGFFSALRMPRAPVLPAKRG